MLRLQDVTKNYKVAGGEIKVLKGLNIAFRKNEFVSILGPSGCGKTTTLNIVGGLDKYTSGDLIVNGKSTKMFTDKDWDVYRNHRIGFIFQSYNLIPHQTVLGNVELALTIAGMSKEERTKKALLALERVGLKGEEKKRPNQLSGGQCQRVAIARALVNEPDILLADEPTGALDSKTSVQIMDLIKQISKDKLVIMVTHNGEIAKEYSTRIIRLVDGEVIEDTNPYTAEQEQLERQNEKQLEKENSNKPKKTKKAKAKMSMWTAFKLSARNLFSKRGRTMLTSVAGSIGIIGISAVIAVSTGVRTYINNMQDDMLSGNPITIQETGYDLSTIMGDMSMLDKMDFIKQEGYVNVDSTMEFLANQYNTMQEITIKNTITKEYIDYIKQMPKSYAAFKMEYGLDVTNNIFTDFKRKSDHNQNISISAIKSIYTSVMEETQFKEQASLIASLGETFMQAPSDNDYIATQYKLLKGKMATQPDEIMIVVNKDRALTDLTLAQLGYYTQEEFINIAHRVGGTGGGSDDAYISELDKQQFTYQELMEKEFVYYYNDDVFNSNFTSPLAKMNPFTYNYQKTANFSQGLPLKIVGILEPYDNINFGCLTAGIYYTEALAQYIIENNVQSEIVKFTQNPKQYIPSLTDEEVLSFNEGFSSMEYGGMSIGITYQYEYVYDEDPTDQIIPTAKTATGYVGETDFITSMMAGMSNQAMADMRTLSKNNIGAVDIPNDISVYPTSFETKDLVVDYLDKWNEEGDLVVNGSVISFEDREEIKYVDNLSLIIDMIDSMIDIVTIALIAFTSLSLVVSSVMIAIITYVSVVERIKEIGVIRSLGGRKSDVSNLFNAETFIIGVASGLVGIGITYLILLIVNVIVNSLAGFSIMILPISSALIMIALSTLLTVLSGLIPAKKAAHQDPVIALRTE